MTASATMCRSRNNCGNANAAQHVVATAPKAPIVTNQANEGLLNDPLRGSATTAQPVTTMRWAATTLRSRRGLRISNETANGTGTAAAKTPETHQVDAMNNRAETKPPAENVKATRSLLVPGTT